MPEVTFKITGLKELSKGLTALGATFERSTLRTGLRAAIRPVVRGGKSRVAVREGHLKRSLIGKARVTRAGYGEAALISRRTGGHVGSRAHFIELGTSTQPAQPFMRPAFDQAVANGDIIGGFVTQINRTIEGRLRKQGVSFGKFEDVEG